jgi:predicted ATPase/DNA-binding SARP family transcriptional activator
MEGEGRSAPLHVTLLGAFHVRVGAHAVPDSVWRLSKARTLLKLLALAPGHRLPRDLVLDLLWPDLEPEAAANNLYGVLHGMRRALRWQDGSAEVRMQHGLVMLQPAGPVTVDVEVFERAAARARHSNDPDLYHQALGLYTGDLLPDDLYEDWAAERREALRETHLRLWLEVARRHEARGELTAAMEALRRVILSDPAREEAHQALMRLYASTGQRELALRQYAQLQETLRRELEVEPDATSQDLYQAIASGQFADAAADETRAAAHNVPLSLTSFVGREGEIDEVKSLLTVARLLTLTGVGGAGKTRLALRVAWDLLGSYSDGVWLVPLASLADGGRLARTVAEALHIPEQPGLPATEALVNALREREILLLLDNCEHLGTAPGELAAVLLAACADLHILATSRARLGVSGEMTVSVRPLSTPDLSTFEAAVESDAVRLFVERARFRRPDFALTPATAPAVTRICRRVEGIPLAIELAAARTGALSLEEIANRLDDAPGFLVAGDSVEARHTTLRGALDWSHDLLDDEERRLFRRLSVFKGGWDIAGAAAVDGDGTEGGTLDLLTKLVDKSLVVVEGAVEAGVRYRFVEPVRQYAIQRRVDAGEEALVRRRHAQYFAAIAETTEQELRGPDARRYLDLLTTEHDNLREALRWAVEAPAPEVGLRIAAGIWRFWFMRGYMDEGRTLLRPLLEIADGVPADLRARALNAAGALAFYQSDTDEALTSYEAALTLYRALGDEGATGRVLSNLGLVLKDRGDSDAAEQLFREALEVARHRDDRRSMASAYGNLGILAQERGAYEEARTLHEQSLALKRELGGKFEVANTLNNLGAIALEQGEYRRARGFLEEALALAVEQGVQRSRYVALVNLGHVARREGNFDEAMSRFAMALRLALEQGEQTAVAMALEGSAAALAVHGGEPALAVTLFTVAGATREKFGTPTTAIERAEYDVILDHARLNLGADFALARDRGLGLTAEAAVALVLDRSDASRVSARSD